MQVVGVACVVKEADFEEGIDEEVGVIIPLSDDCDAFRVARQVPVRGVVCGVRPQ
jgi:hypothetical protein